MAKARIVYQVDDKQLDDLQKQLNEIKKSNKEVEDSFKGSNEEIKKGGGALNDLKGTIAGLGLAAVATKAVTEFAKLTQEVNKNRKEVALLTNETGKALDNITAKLRATSQVFGKDFNEVLRTANSLSKTFGVTLPEAIDKVNEGFTFGLDVNGEYLHTLQEYDNFIKKAGINIDQFNALIQKQVTTGVFSDKGIDAIKEAQISLQEMTHTTQDAINGVGLSADQISKDIASGTKTYFESIQEIVARTNAIADPRKTGAILADVFRGAGEDAFEYILTLDDIPPKLEAVSDAQRRYIERQNELITATETTQLKLAQFSASIDGAGTSLQIFWEKVKSETIGALNDIVTAFISSEQQVENFKNSIAGTDKGTLTGVITDLETQIADLQSRIEGQTLSYGPYSARVTATKEKIKILNDELEIAKSKLNEVEAAEKAEREEQERLNKEKEDAAAKSLLAVQAKEREIQAAKDNAQALREEREEFETGKRDEEAFQRETDLLIKQFETKKDRESEFTDFLAEENKKRAESAEEYRAQDIQAEADHQERKRELINTAIDGFIDILGSFNELRIQQINQELQANELARNRELELAEGNATKQAEINKKFDSEQAKLRTKQVNAQKQAQLFSAIVNTARAVVEALPNIPLSVLVGALGAAQIGFIAAQQPPKFAKGVIDLQGPGTGTSDSITAYLSRGESVMTAQETRDFMPTLKAIRSREIKPEIINRIVADKMGPNITVNDYDKLAQAVINQPKFNMNMDENGFSVFMQRQMSSLSIKQSKYRMS